MPLVDALEFRNLRIRLDGVLMACLRDCGIAESQFDGLRDAAASLALWVHGQRHGQAPLVVGITGAQGTGKSTLSRLLATALQVGFEHQVAVLSLDDLYLTRAERSGLAAAIHPLLKTRGPPGTHDTQLGMRIIEALRSAGPNQQTVLPSFDKACDDRRPHGDGPVFTGRADIILFEGWCIGAKPEPQTALQQPLNDLEAKEDADGTWRRYVNNRLATDYACLFGMLDRLIMLKAPDLASVHRWRALQEAKLAANSPIRPSARIMDESALHRFLMHYERLTRAMLGEMSGRADLVLHLNEQHCFTQIGVNSPL